MLLTPADFFIIPNLITLFKDKLLWRYLKVTEHAVKYLEGALLFFLA